MDLQLYRIYLFCAHSTLGWATFTFSQTYVHLSLSRSGHHFGVKCIAHGHSGMWTETTIQVFIYSIFVYCLGKIYHYIFSVIKGQKMTFTWTSQNIYTHTKTAVCSNLLPSQWKLHIINILNLSTLCLKDQIPQLTPDTLPDTVSSYTCPPAGLGMWVSV